MSSNHRSNRWLLLRHQLHRRLLRFDLRLRAPPGGAQQLRGAVEVLGGEQGPRKAELFDVTKCSKTGF